MSQKEKSDETQPRLQLNQSAPAAQTNEVVVDDSEALATYSNFCRVTATPEEVILDFGLNPQPFSAVGQTVKANQRLVMNFYTTKRLLAAIATTIQRHEQTFGVIELDIRRRVSGVGPQVAPPGLLRPSNQPEPLKLS